MSKFSDQAPRLRVTALDDGPRRASRVVALDPSAFADTWEDKPTGPIDVGLRSVPELEMLNARSRAQQIADRMHPRLGPDHPIWIETYNQTLMHWLIGHAMCQPDDIRRDFWQVSAAAKEMIISDRLTSDGTLRLFEELEVLRILDSPLSPEIDGSGIDFLRSELAGPLFDLPPERQRPILRLLARVAEAIDEAREAATAAG